MTGTQLTGPGEAAPNAGTVGSPALQAASQQLRTTAHVVGRALADVGVAHAFGVLGSGNLAATNALVGAGVPYTAARHEGGAASMAAAFHQAGGGVAVCSVHQGPGLTNAMTGIADAAKRRTPMIVLAGDSSAGATTSNFYIDQAAVAVAAGAIAERVVSPASAVEDVHRAMSRTVLESRPVVLNVPLDVQAGPPHPGSPASLPSPSPPAPSMPAIERLANLLTVAERPVLLLGRGVDTDGAEAAIRELGDHVGALFATSALAHGRIVDSPWNLGIAGGFSNPTTATLLREADLIVGFGVGFRGWTTQHGGLLADGVTLAQVDVDPTAFGRHHHVDVEVVGDAALTARAVLEHLDASRVAASWRDEALAQRIANGPWKLQPYDDVSADGRLDPRTVSIQLNDALPVDRTVVVDGGDNTGYPILYFDVPDPAGFVFTSAGFQSIGLALASAVGAARARPDRTTVVTVGDGGLLMAAAELETVARLQLDLIVVAYNDAAYGAEVHHFEPEGEPVDLVRFPRGDLAGFASGVGLAARQVTTLGELETATSWVRETDGPRLLDVHIDPDVVLDWAAEAFKGH